MSQHLQSTPPSEFGAYLIEQFDGHFEHAIDYLEQVIGYLRDKTKAVEKEQDLSSQAIVSTDSIIEANDKFLSDKSNFILNYGKKEVFMAGLESYIGRPKNPRILECMEHEHNVSDNSFEEFSPPNNPQLLTTPAEEWMFVTNPSSYRELAAEKQRFILDRKIITVEELMRTETSTAAGLTEAEIIAARLYTGPMFKLYNEVLRKPNGPGRQNFVYTIHAFASCIVKLSRVHRITTLYRGIKGGALPQAFLKPDEHGTRGGVEYGFMSTTTDKRVAYDYASLKDGSTRKAAVIYEIEEGAIDRGADVSWLSQFPSENEVVFPPLTNLEVFGDPKLVEGAIVTRLRVNINLRTRTVDEIVEMSKTQFREMVEWYFDEVKNANLVDCDPRNVFPAWLDDFARFKEKMLAEDANRFNQQHFYRDAVDEALNLKEGTIQKVRVLHLLSQLIPAGSELTIGTLQQTISRLERTHASKFADRTFVSRYVEIQLGSCDRDGNVAMANYGLLWSLPLERGSWATIVRANSALMPVVIATQYTCAQRIRDFAFSLGFGFIKGLWRQLIGFEAVDTLLGFDGVYYYIGLSAENNTPFYQLSKKESLLSCKYLYYKGSRWYVGSTLGSTRADLRSESEGDATPSTVRRWEKTKTPMLLAYAVASPDYVLDEVTTVRLFGDASVELMDEESAGNPLWNGPKISEINLGAIGRRGSRGSSASGGLGPDRATSRQPQQQGPEIFSHDGEKGAFAYRIIEEKEALVKSGSKRDSGHASSGSTRTSSKATFDRAELNSIAVFCEQTSCPLPKEVSSCLRKEAKNAALVSALLIGSILCGLVLAGPTFYWLGSVRLGLSTVLRGDRVTELAWFALGQITTCIVITVVLWSSLLRLLTGWTLKAAVGIFGLVTGFGILDFSVWIIGTDLLAPVGRGIIAFTLPTLVAVILLAHMYVFSFR